MSIEVMKAMANYIDVLGGNSKKYRQAIAKAEKHEVSQEPVCEMCKSTHGKWSWICGNCLLIHDKQSTSHGIKEKNNG